MSYRKLDLERVRELVKDDIPCYRAMVPLMQIMIFTMIGGGHLGSFAAEQPADFYIDARVGRLPYARREIFQAIAVYTIIAEETGLNPHSMPKMPFVHHCGVF